MYPIENIDIYPIFSVENIRYISSIYIMPTLATE